MGTSASHASSKSHLHPVRVVIRRTGLTADLLRAWERRYAAVTPRRSAGGQRLYTDDDIERLQLLQRLTTHGHPIGSVATLETGELRSLLVEEETAPGTAVPADADERLHAEILQQALQLVEELDDRELEALLRRSARRFGVPIAIERVIAPLMFEIGERWHRRELSPAHEHLASGVVERTLHWMFDGPTQAPDAPRIALATTQGERHEIGIQVAAAVAASESWRVVYLGADLPAESVVQATLRSGVRVLALSVVATAGAPSALEQLRTIRDALPASVVMVVGGAGAVASRDALPSGITVLDDLAALRGFLRSFRQAHAR